MQLTYHAVALPAANRIGYQTASHTAYAGIPPPEPEPQVSLMKAICAAFPDRQEPAFCNHLGRLDCAPDGPGGRECGSAANVRAANSSCVDTFMGWTCECAIGYLAAVDAEGRQVCTDVDECQTAPCRGGSKRTVCHNLPGSFRRVSAASGHVSHVTIASHLVPRIS